MWLKYAFFQVHSATMGGADPSLSNCMSTQMSLQCMHSSTTARGGNYQHRLPPLPVDNGTNGSINTSGSGTALTSQSNDSHRADMHNNPGFEPDFGDVSTLAISNHISRFKLSV